MLSITEQFQNLLEDVKGQVQGAFPIEGRKRTLHVKNVRYDDAGAEKMFDWSAIRKIKDNEGTFASNLRGDLELVDNETGKVVDTQKNSVLARVPHMTGLGSFVINGKDLQIVNQLRRRPGIYPAFTPDDNVRTKLTSTGADYDVILDRATGQYLMKVGTSNLKLVPFLEGIGVKPQDIKAAIGEGAYTENISAGGSRDEVLRFWNKVRSKAPSADRNELVKDIHTFMESKPLDPDVSQETIGVRHDKISANALVDAMRAAKEVAQGKRPPADMESLSFKSIHSVEDFVGERLRKALPGIRRNLGYIVDRAPKLRRIIGPDVLSKPIMSQFTTSEFTRYADQNNPIDILSKLQAVTVMGEGGISSIHRVTDEVRNLHSTHLGFIDPVHTAENQLIGLSNHLTEGVTKKGNHLFRQVYDVKQQKMVQKSPVDLARAVVAFPDEYKVDDPKRPKSYTPIKSKVLAMNKGQFNEVSAKSVDYIIPTTSAPFSFATNAVPFLHSNSGARMLMAGRHMEQAVPLVDRDVPLVQSEYHGHPYNDVVGAVMLTKARKPGVVTKVGPEEIHIHHDGDKKSTPYHIPDHYALNSEAFMTEIPVVGVGDRVKANQSLTESNFSKNQSLAVGKNLITAFMPWKGHNFEDGIVISESAAKKLASEHKHELKVEKDQNTTISAKKLFAQFPHLKTPDAWSEGREDLPKVGDVIKPGQILIPAITKNVLGPQTEYDRIHKALTKPFKDSSVRWMEMVDGEVVRVVNNPNFTKVYVKTREPMVIGDKLSTRHGSKGIVTKITPDNEMPRNADGDVVDVLFNPYGIPGRMNPGIMFETAMGKVAQKTGKNITVKNFGDLKSQVKWVQDQLKQHKLTDTETVWDPTHNKSHEKILTGPLHWIKLKHQVRNKLSARGHQDAYTIDGRPAKGGVGALDESTSAQSVGPLEVYSLMAGGQTEFLKDVAGIKSNRNVDYWNAYQLGLPTPPPVVPQVLDKFHKYLQGAGVNLRMEGNTIKALPMTDKDILARSKGVITEPTVVRTSGAHLIEEKGGLFDRSITGGTAGKENNWAHIELAEPILHPLYEAPAMALTGLKKKEFSDILAGKTYVDKDGELHSSPGPDRVTAGLAMERLLGKINVDSDLRSTQARLRTVNKTDRPKLMKQVRYLSALKQMNLIPKEAFINKYIPVIPPSARPIYAMGDGNLNVADPNHGYREVLFVNRSLQDLKKAGVEEDLLQPQREGLYRSVVGMVGLSEPMTRNANFKGFISAIAGPQNKLGLFQSQVVKRTQDLTGRSTIIVDPTLHVDEIGIPFKMAQKIFAPFAIRQMVTSFGLKPIDARTELEEMTPRAQKVLENVAAERPVIMNRAPSLHKFSTVAVKAKLVPGQAIQVNPLIVGGLNADFDGDTAAIHVPVSEKARIQSWEKLPSRTLLSPKDLSVIHGPSKEALYGLYAMTNPSAKKAVSVKTPADVLKLVQSRKLDMNDPVNYQNKTWTAGHFVINNDLPKEYQIDNQPLTGGRTKDLINRMAKDATLRGKAGDLITKLKDHGFTHATTLGTSISLDDLTSAQLDTLHNKIIPKVNQLAKKDPLKAISWGSENASKAMEQLKNNRLAELTYKSGAGGKYKTNVQQMVLAPIGVQDVKGNVVPVPITRGYAEGMNLGSYWATLPGMRKGIADRALATADTGAFAKELQNTTIHMRIVEDDCGTTDGVDLPINHPDLQGRFMSSNGRMLDGSLMKSLRSKNVKTVKVRSPATCHAHSGICAKCMGTNEHGGLYNKGFHVGTLVGTTISEPLTQMVMRCNAGENLVTVRISGKVRVAALHQLWDELSGTVHEDDGVELKQVSGVDVWDGNQWTEVYFIERHDPDDELVLQLLENGRALVAQKNHPTWARKQKIVCGCGSTSFTELGRSSYLAEGSVKKVYTQCDRCGERADIPESEWLEFVETVVDLGDSTGLFIQTHAPLDPAECTPPVAPYVAGIFVAEGHVERRKYGDIQRGRRAGGNIPYAMKSALPIAFSVTQNPGEGQNFILDKLAEYKTSVSGKTIRVHDGKLAASFLDWFGSGARNKQIPAAWLGAPKSWLIDFLSGVIDGDGTIDSQSNRVCLDTTSLTLANQVAWIAERLGGRSRMYTTPWREHSKHQGYRVDLYLPVQLTGFKKIKLAVRKEFDDLSQVNDLKDVVYSGKVYDLATATRRFTANGVVTHNSFHTGGAVGGTEVGYKRISQIFNMPANMRGKAPLASRDGVVENIVDTDRGGYEVHIDGVKHFVPTELDLSVKVGDKIRAGDKLSRYGVIHPRELAQHKGIEAARDLLLNDIDTEMRLSGQNIRRRVYEAAVRPLIDKAIVVDPGDAEKEHDIQPGDVVSSNFVRSLNKKLKNPIKAEPHLMSVKEVPFTSTDFIGPLMAQRLPRTLKQAPAIGAVTKLKGFEAHPIVEYAYGKMASDEELTVVWSDD